ncbi:hypothetical protein LTR66_007463 [Elasticomyces elasticus]|nr:hypothetical protein LTR66_007463 [Elasticomyces elasticus]KAK5008063.1 hypothetical protein LTR28_004480 [Elasticomyces elasticus]
MPAKSPHPVEWPPYTPEPYYEDEVIVQSIEHSYTEDSTASSLRQSSCDDSDDSETDNDAFSTDDKDERESTGITEQSWSKTPEGDIIRHAPGLTALQQMLELNKILIREQGLDLAQQNDHNVVQEKGRDRSRKQSSMSSEPPYKRPGSAKRQRNKLMRERSVSSQPPSRRPAWLQKQRDEREARIKKRGRSPTLPMRSEAPRRLRDRPPKVKCEEEQPKKGQEDEKVQDLRPHQDEVEPKPCEVLEECQHIGYTVHYVQPITFRPAHSDDRPIGMLMMQTSRSEELFLQGQRMTELVTQEVEANLEYELALARE